MANVCLVRNEMERELIAGRRKNGNVSRKRSRERRTWNFREGVPERLVEQFIQFSGVKVCDYMGA